MANATPAVAAGLDVLFDFAAVRTARDLARFTAEYGPVMGQPGLPLVDSVSAVLYWASWVCTALHRELRARDAAGAPFPPPPPSGAPPGTLLTIVLERLRAVQTTRLPLAVCPTDGRFFSPANPRARYCRPACAATAAKWRAEHHLTTPRPTRARTAVERLPVAEEPP
jgi:hypothetical protein